MGRSRTKKHVVARILTKSHDLQQYWRSGAPAGVANSGLVFEPGAPIPWGSICLVDGVFVEVQAPRWVVHQRLFLPLFERFWRVKSQANGHGNNRRLIVDCDGFSFALVANDGSF